MAHYNEDEDPNVKAWERQEKQAAKSLFEQAAMISKSHGYDILSAYVKELKETMRSLISVGELEDLKFTDQKDTEAFQLLVKKAKLLSI